MDVSEIFTSIRERLRSPLFGNFTVSWLAFNWKIPYLTLFVSEKYLYANNKIDAILNIIKEYQYPHLNLWMGPVCYTVFMIFLYPFIYNQLEKVRLEYQKRLNEINDQRDMELKPIKLKYDQLKHYYDKLNETRRRECKSGLLKFDKKAERLFDGYWNIEIYNKDVTIFYNCFLINEKTFCDQNSTVLSITDISLANENNNQPTDDYDRAEYTLSVTYKGKSDEYYLVVISRDLIELRFKSNKNGRIRLHWLGMLKFNEIQ